MKKQVIGMVFSVLAGGVMSLVHSCTKQFDNSDPRFTVNMTDAPAGYDSVVVYIKTVSVNHDSSGKWMDIPAKTGYYDLLRLQGTETPLVNNLSLSTGYLYQLRLKLDEDKNYVVDTFGNKIPLELASQDKTGLKIDIGTSIWPGEKYKLLIDFDAGTSILDQGSGMIRLKPVLKKISLDTL